MTAPDDRAEAALVVLLLLAAVILALLRAAGCGGAYPAIVGDDGGLDAGAP